MNNTIVIIKKQNRQTMTSSLSFKGKTFIDKVTRKQFFKMMTSVVFCFGNSYRFLLIK